MLADLLSRHAHHRPASGAVPLVAGGGRRRLPIVPRLPSVVRGDRGLRGLIAGGLTSRPAGLTALPSDRWTQRRQADYTSTLDHSSMPTVDATSQRDAAGAARPPPIRIGLGIRYRAWGSTHLRG